MITTLV